MSKTSFSISDELLKQIEALAQSLDITTEQLVERAIIDFAKKHNLSESPEKINQGELYWVQLNDADIPHPHVIVQDDVLNHSRIETVVVCALTSNAKRVNIPGNVLLDEGEGDLSRRSVVEVGKVSTLNKSQLGDYIGSLSPQRVKQILDGMRFQQVSFFN